jgi:hypothetical protein
MKAFKPALAALIIVAVGAAAVYAYVEWVPFGRYPGGKFFDLAAQTIPILLVALAVETQVRGFDRARRWKLMRIAAVILLGAGEITAVMISAGLLHPVRGTTTSDVFVVVTAIGLLGGFLCVIAVAVSTAPQASGHSAGTSTRRHAPGAGQAQPTLPARPGPRPKQAVPTVALLLTGAVLTKALAGFADRCQKPSR